MLLDPKKAINSYVAHLLHTDNFDTLGARPVRTYHYMANIDTVHLGYDPALARSVAVEARRAR